jgi:hypothetical protein
VEVAREDWTVTETLTYLYGVAPADAPEPPADLEGIDGAPVRVVRGDRMAGVVSNVAAEHYSDAALDERLADLGWVGPRGIAHERVLDWFAERGPLVPLSLFSLHRDESRVLERLAADADRLERVLARLSGRREWGVKLWREESIAADHLAELSPAAAQMQGEIDQAPPGKQFLLRKKLDAFRAEELRRVSTRISHQVYAELRSAADGSVSVQIPPSAGAANRTLILHAAFLVPDGGFETFRGRLSALAGGLRPRGFDFEFSGPWPAYHFSDLDA